MDYLSDAAVFCKVVEQGSFTAAADALQLSKAVVSKYVKRLETRLDARLLNRTTRKVSTTGAGEAFYARAAHALAELEEAQREVRDQTGQPRGHLRVSAPTFYGAEILSRQLVAFHLAYPEISMDLVLENRFVDLVAERFDLAIRLSAPKDSSLVMRKLANIPMVVCASSAYLERHGRPSAPDDLRKHDCLIYSIAPRTHEWTFLREDGRRHAVPVRGTFRINDDHVGRQAALDGLGILHMPKLFLEDALISGDLIQLFPDNAMAAATLALVYPSRHALPAKVRAFLDFMVGRLGKTTWKVPDP